MSRRPLAVSLISLAAVIAAAALPAGATHPGDNGKIVFERPTPNGSNLFTVSPSGSRLTRLTGARGVEGDASWSEDGRKVAFTRAEDAEGPYEIWVVNANGSGLKRLTRHRGFSVAPAFSPDGRKIAYASDGGSANHLSLWVMNVDGSDKQRLRRSRRGRNYTDPQFQPNNTRIAFAIITGNGNRPRKFDSSIAVVNAFDGSAFRRLTRAGGPDELNPNWQPNEGVIAYEHTERFPVRQSDIAMMNFDGSEKRLITTTNVYETNPSFAPDSTRIAFTSDRDNRQLSTDRLGRGFELYTMALDGSDIERLTDNRKPDLFPDWQVLGR
jgi:TolB protein